MAHVGQEEVVHSNEEAHRPEQKTVEAVVVDIVAVPGQGNYPRHRVWIEIGFALGIVCKIWGALALNRVVVPDLDRPLVALVLLQMSSPRPSNPISKNPKRQDEKWAWQPACKLRERCALEQEYFRPHAPHRRPQHNQAKGTVRVLPS